MPAHVGPQHGAGVVTERHEVPVRWCPAHESVALFMWSTRCLDAAAAHLSKPCPLTPPLFHETPTKDTPNE